MENKKYVSFRIAKLNNHRVGNQVAHDMRIGWQPKYIDYERMKDNVLLYGNEFNKHILADLRKEQNTRSKRKIQKNTERFFSGIFTFSNTMKDDYKNNPEMFESCSKKFCEELESQFGLQISYAQLHLDESNPHVHLLFDNISKIDGKAIRRKINPEKLKQCQTLMAECFEPMGYVRGQEDSKKYHLNVKQLHEIDIVREQCNNDINQIQNLFNKIIDNERLTPDEKEGLKVLIPNLYQFIEDISHKDPQNAKTNLKDTMDRVLKIKSLEEQSLSDEAIEKVEKIVRYSEKLEKDNENLTKKLSHASEYIEQEETKMKKAKNYIKELQDALRATIEEKPKKKKSGGRKLW